ncbi:branched-chain amino acid transport system II carrier protein [Psychromonas sp. CD1]|uniref:branched-chain amino acid transport system II carrier protein n=1 Tax=Psychromonas sp. CD1 TaxID=1979839 RepID=UPI000B9A638E|nr:branched-chain amino acid transport system II carrier protein [Psychromonas sp. CD1]
MNQKLSTFDIIGLGFMSFAFFLGAGNLIFPPLAGSLAGENTLLAILGFLVTAVGLPLLTLIAVAKAGGGLTVMAKYLPGKIATLFALIIFVIIGPSFATPRTALVAFEIGIRPFIMNETSMHLAIFSVLFFTIVAGLSISTGKLLDMIGKVITPLLIVLLIILATAVVLHPLADIGAASAGYVDTPFITGILEGYNTMDTLGALVFGMLIINVIKSKGITSRAVQYKYLIISGLMTAVGLTFVYASLFYLGATSHSVAININNGGEIISLYVQALFGISGQYLLSLVVGLACLTTAVGLVSALSDFLVELKPNWNRKFLVILNCILCAFVTNVGLSQLIQLSIPVLYTVYPVAIALVALTYAKDKLANKPLSYSFVLGTSLVFGLLDGIKVTGINIDILSFIPLFDENMEWFLPSILALLISIFMFKNKTKNSS